MLDIIIGKLTDEVINKGIDITKEWIKTEIEKQQPKSIQAEIYRVIIESLNLITLDRYRNNQDVIYDAAEILLRLFKDGKRDKSENIKICLNMICPCASNDMCEKFEEILYRKICNEENQELYRYIILQQRENKNGYGQENVKKSRILWVDDNPDDVKSIRDVLRDIDFDIARTTKQGLDLFKKKTYDVIITDMKREGKRDAGIILINELKCLDCKAPVVVCTCPKSKQEYGVEALRLGAYVVIDWMPDIISVLKELC